MNSENYRLNLEQVIAQVSATPKNAAVVYNEHLTLWQSLGLSQAQVALWLASLPIRNQQKQPAAAYQLTPEIAEHLITLLQQSGGRLAMTQVLKKLPAGITTSEQQIRKLAQQHTRLDVKGPLLVLAD